MPPVAHVLSLEHSSGQCVPALHNGFDSVQRGRVLVDNDRFTLKVDILQRVVDVQNRVVSGHIDPEKRVLLTQRFQPQTTMGTERAT